MGLFSSLGGILGGAVGSIFPGVGTVIGAGLGSAIGGGIDDNRANKKAEGYYNKNMDFAQRQFQFQQDYIKNSAQWRVEDAKKAGLHPMAALGMSTPSFSPVSAPSAPEYASSSNFDPMEFGQNLNYPATKGKTAQQQQQMTDLTIKGLELDNEYKQAQIDQMKVDTLASSIASNQAFGSPPSPKVNLQEPTGLPRPSVSDAFSVRHIRDNDYDINYITDYQQELGDEFGQAYNMLRKATRENGSIWTDPKTGAAYVFNRNSGFWNRLDALSVEEAERLLGKPSHSGSGVRPVPSSHFVRNRHRYRY